MHKKLEADLISLAHSILQLKNKEDVFILKQKASEVYEKLSLLAYIEEYINTIPNVALTKKDFIAKIEVAETLKKKRSTEKTTQQQQLEKEKNTENTKTTPFIKEPDAILGTTHIGIKNDANDIGALKAPPTLEEELQDTLSVDETVNLFTKAPHKTINDQFQNTIQIGLNDRIVFVKNLFNGNQESFNRVLSQLNTFTHLKDAKKFITNTVKPDYNWSNNQELEERFFDIIEKRFN